MQAILPLIPDGSTAITDILSVQRRDGQLYYFCGINPVFTHEQKDVRSFRMFTSQLVSQGMCQQVDIVRAFGVSANSVKRAVKKYRQGSIDAFYASRKGRGATVLSEEVKACAQGLLDAGAWRGEVAEKLGIKADTLRKAIEQGRLHEPTRGRENGEHGATDKSHRSALEAEAPMGTACTRTVERVLAAFGLLGGASTHFESCRDVSFGGLLCALPALAANGLFRHLSACFTALKGYYSTLHVLILLSYMALGRIRTVEQLRYQPPGELGKLLGLDRIPEVRCLRRKLSDLCLGDTAERWSARLSRDWMEAQPDLAGTLYVDGHVRVYHGSLTSLPPRYISPERLCLRGTTDYWVNDALGQPFFVVERPVDEGLLNNLREQIVPRLLQEVPHQPSEEALRSQPLLHRFILVFDREGYSPAFFKQMWQEHRIACISYHKYPSDPWPLEEFQPTEVLMPNGERLSLKLAERGSRIGDRHTGLWLREVRKLSDSGHQTSLLSTAYSRFSSQDAAVMFSRWAQENFFGYMMQHFGIDLVCEYGTEEIPGPQRVVNPQWREMDGSCRSLKAKLAHSTAAFGAMTLHPELDSERYAQWESRKAQLAETIQQLETQLQQTTQRRKQTPKHIALEDLPEAQQFQRLAPSRKRLLDAVKMIAYRTETTMAMILREHLGRPDDARALLRDLYRSEADMLPDPESRTLQVRIHHMANPQADRAISSLLQHLNDAEFIYPGTDMRLVYSLTQGP